MKSILIIFIVLLSLSFSSCGKDKTLLQPGIQISYIDKNGNDLMNPANPVGIKATNIDIYYIINGVKTRVLDGNMDMPENFRITEYDNFHKYCLDLAANDKYDANKMSETLIDFGNRVDTLTVSWTVLNDGYSVHGVWYNHVLKAADYYSTSTGPITITVE